MAGGFPFGGGGGGIPFPFAAAAAAAAAGGGDPRFFRGGGFPGGMGGMDEDEGPSANDVDYYEVLGVSRDASAADIRKAYKRLRVQSHPDRPGGSTEKFQAVNRAGTVLTNPKLKEAFDRGGEKMVKRMEGMMGDDRADSTRRSLSSVPPVRMRIGVGLSKLTSDFKVKVPVERKIIVPADEVDSAPPGSQLAMMRLPPTNAATRVYVRELTEQVELTVPAGCPDGRKLLIHGMGHQIREDKGDVEVQISVKSERGFESEGPNLLTRVKVPLHVALLGGTINLRHLDGRRLRIKIPAGSPLSDDDKLMVRNEGLPIANLSGDARGVLVGIVKVSWPKRISLDGVSEEELEIVRRVLSGKGGSATLSGAGADGSGAASEAAEDDDEEDEDDRWGPETPTTRAAGREDPKEVESVPFDDEEFRAAVNAARDDDADEDARGGPGGATVVECTIA